MDLRHGVFVAPFHAVEENPTLCLQRDLELVQLVDELGFARGLDRRAPLGRHGDHRLAGDVHRRRRRADARIRLGTGVVSLPYHHPLNVANRIIQLDHMTHGRVMFGAGPGLLASDALMMGIEPEATRDRMAEGLDAILRLLAGRGGDREVPTGTPSARAAPTSCPTPSPSRGLRGQRRHPLGRPAGRPVRPRACCAWPPATGPASTPWTPTGRWPCEIAAEHGREMDRSRGCGGGEHAPGRHPRAGHRR